MPAVGELAVLPTYIQATQVHLVRLAVLELDELAQAGQELCVPVRAVLVGQDGELAVALWAEMSTVAPAPPPPRLPGPQVCARPSCPSMCLGLGWGEVILDSLSCISNWSASKSAPLDLPNTSGTLAFLESWLQSAELPTHRDDDHPPSTGSHTRQSEGCLGHLGRVTSNLLLRTIHGPPTSLGRKVQPPGGPRRCPRQLSMSALPFTSLPHLPSPAPAAHTCRSRTRRSPPSLCPGLDRRCEQCPAHTCIRAPAIFSTVRGIPLGTRAHALTWHSCHIPGTRTVPGIGLHEHQPCGSSHSD